MRGILVGAVAVVVGAGCSNSAPAQAPAVGPGSAVPVSHGDEPVPPLPARIQKLDAYLAGELARLHVPGAAAAVIGRDGIVWQKTYGVADLASHAPVQLATRFRLGSITKVVTALAVLQLRDAGVLSLDAPASTWLPELAAVIAPTRDSPPITLRQLMTHTSGLPREPQIDDPYGQHHEVTEAELVASLKTTRLESPPGTVVRYSNLGAALEGVIIARAAKQPYAARVAQALLAPLGMATATFDRAAVPAGALATSYLRDKAGSPATIAPQLREGATAARGQLYATIGDVGKLVTFELDAWPARDDVDAGPVRRSTVRESQRTEGPFAPGAHTKGAGWFLDLTPRGQLVSHGGAGEGFMSELWFSTSAELGFAILINDDDNALPAIARRAQELLLPVPPSAIAVVAQLLDDPSAQAAQRLVDADYLQGMTARGSLAKFAKLRASTGPCSVVSVAPPEPQDDQAHGVVRCGAMSYAVTAQLSDAGRIAFLRVEAAP